MSSVIALLFPSIPVLIVCLFIMGFGIGGEYSLDSDYISELMPDKWKFIMVGSAKAASALGNICVAGICFMIVRNWTDPSLWPHLLWIIIAISLLMILLRIRFWESPDWLMKNGKVKLAESDLHKFLGNEVNIVESATNPLNKTASSTMSWGSFLRQNFRNVVFTGIPWACEGLGVYGIGVFLPILVMALGIEHVEPGESSIHHVANSVEITLWISCIILPGFIIGLCLINKVKGAFLQGSGFLLSAASLFILLLAYRGGWDKWISIGAFMLFELFLNIGPHLMTYVLPSKVFPEEVRGQGSGIAASIGKSGAVLGVFFIPLLLKWGGTECVLIVSASVMILGALITFLFKPRNVEGL